MPNNNPLVVDVTGLNKYFDGKHAVIDVNLSIKRGEIYGFLGPNGSGKTTTLRMICGLLTPDSGVGHCLGYDILTEKDLIKRNVGYMTQRFTLYEDLSIYENMDFIAKAFHVNDRKNTIKIALDNLGLAHRQNQLAGTLSGGWKQRLALSCALIHDPQLLLLDEPTAGVDPKARRVFWDNIHDLSDTGITTLVSTHYMDEAERCTQLGYINCGKILTTGTKEYILDNSGLHTWQLTHPDIRPIHKWFNTHKTDELIVIMGDKLHISSVNEEHMNLLLEQAKTLFPDIKLTRIKPTLEDVFIQLTGTEEIS